MEKLEEKSSNNLTVKQCEKLAVKVSILTLIFNVFLSCFKLVAGIVGSSYAMLADAVHSFSDVLTTVIVIIGVKISSREADKEHPYGHDRFECVTALVLAFTLFAVGLSIGYSALQKLISGSYKTAEIPKAIALVASIVSIVVQGCLFGLAFSVSKKINSGSLKADAYHHLSDSLSSIGSFIGIFGAMMGFAILDVLVGFVICLLIIKVAVSIFMDSINKLTDHSASEKTESEILNVALGIQGVQSVDMLHTRQFGNMMYVEIEIACDEKLELKQAHAIAEEVHREIESKFKQTKHCMVHVNPIELQKENIQTEG